MNTDKLNHGLHRCLRQHGKLGQNSRIHKHLCLRSSLCLSVVKFSSSLCCPIIGVHPWLFLTVSSLLDISSNLQYTYPDMHTTFSALPLDMNGLTIHFTGIKGTGMTALVEVCKERGASITGSDVEDTFYTDQILSSLGIKALPFDEKNISSNINVLFYSSAYDVNTHCELVKARELSIPMMEYSEALGKVSESAYSCGIAGVHGKTTTTGMTGTILQELDLKSQVLAGSAIASFGGTCTMNKGTDIFVAETCEYKRHFLHFHPQKILLTSIESDHQDYFPLYSDILKAFCEYIELLPKNGTLIFCAADKGACEAVTISMKTRPDISYIPYGTSSPDFEKLQKLYAFTPKYLVKKHSIANSFQTFTLEGIDTEFILKVPGFHNVLNAAGSIALCIELIKEKRSYDDADALTIKNALEKFTGSKRRSEIIGITRTPPAVFIDDYGHHPTAVKVTIEGFKSFYPDYLLIADFMSHTYSRTHALLDEFASSFNAADEVILHKIYSSAREKKEDFEGKVSGRILFDKTKMHNSQVKYFEEVLDAKDYVIDRLNKSLPDGKKGYVFVTMGAGDNWKLGKAVFEQISGNK